MLHCKRIFFLPDRCTKRFGSTATCSVAVGMLAFCWLLPRLTGTVTASSQAGCSTRAIYRHSPLYAADHSGSASGTACRAQPNSSHKQIHQLANKGYHRKAPDRPDHGRFPSAQAAAVKAAKYEQ